MTLAYLIIADRHEPLRDTRPDLIARAAMRRACETGRRVAVANDKGRRIMLVLPDPLFREA